jgi:II/X family phage/plasmid replication protein
MYFLDKLEMYQIHQEKLPLVGGNAFLPIDLETGETSEQPNVFNKQYEGSFTSTLRIRCDGHKVVVRGNPSRWNRIDNLFGLQTIDECVLVYNQILAKLGLPPFTKNTKVIMMPSKTGTHTRVGNGAVITHLDFTTNHYVGYGKEQTFLKALSTQSINRSIPAYLYPNENTVEWFSKNFQGNGSSFRYVKCYTKAADLIRNERKRCSKQDHQAIDYYTKLINYCIQMGVVREEHSYKSKFLKNYKLDLYGITKENDFDQLNNCITEIRKRLEVTHMKYELISDQLLAQDICKSRQAANSTQNYYSLWLHGHQLEKQSTQYRVHKARLKQLGIDISIKLDISRSPLRLVASEVIEVRPLPKPDWYIDPISANCPTNVVQFKAA